MQLLSEFLRERLGLTGTKVGCGEGVEESLLEPREAPAQRHGGLGPVPGSHAQRVPATLVVLEESEPRCWLRNDTCRELFIGQIGVAGVRELRPPGQS